MKIAINSKTTGKFKKAKLNNRDHIVTNMVPIVGNSVMNNGFYPLEEVQKSFDQLHFLPAPNGHPKINNQVVSAFHPLAVNAFNIGGLVRNPKMDGDKVVNEFWLDIDIANKSEDGQELIRRIENGEEVGVSTGLQVRQSNEQGSHEGKDYSWIANDLNFDHVAILLNELPAGSDAGTYLQNEDQGISIVNCEASSPPSIGEKILSMLGIKLNAMTANEIEMAIKELARQTYPEPSYWLWIHSLFPTENTVIMEVESRTDGSMKLVKSTYGADSDGNISLLSDWKEVKKQVEFVEVDGDVNMVNNDPLEDENMGDKTQQQKDVTNSDDVKELNLENAINLLEEKGFKVNTKEEAEQLQYFIDNRDKFESVINAEESELNELRADLVANSDLTEEDVKGMSKDMLTRLSSTVKPAQNYSVAANATADRLQANEESSEGDFQDSYTEIKE